MNHKLPFVLIVLSLTACVQQPVKDASPASDLDAYLANVKREGKIRTLPNGKTYCVEDALTEKAQDECATDLEDTLFKANRGLTALVRRAEDFVHALKLQRNPCSWWERVRRVPRCAQAAPRNTGE